MPTQTFFNLKEDKRKKILDIAIEEFALNDYKSASVTKIVNKANIAKGSMYRYFENKKDLYLYIINIIAKKKFNYLENNLTINDENFFKQLKEMHLTGLEFDLNNIRYSRILINLGNEVNNKEIGEEVHKFLEQSKKFMKDFVKRGQTKGEIRNDLDFDFIFFLIDKINLSIVEYLELKYNFSYDNIIKNNKNMIPISKSDLENELDNFINVLEDGLSTMK